MNWAPEACMVDMAKPPISAMIIVFKDNPQKVMYCIWHVLEMLGKDYQSRLVDLGKVEKKNLTENRLVAAEYCLRENRS